MKVRACDIFLLIDNKMNVLYVASDKNIPEQMCPGSTVCLSLAEKIPENMISIQNCDILREQETELPDWLNGTPIFINEEEGVPYRGRDAINKINKMLKHISKSRKIQPVQGQQRDKDSIRSPEQNILQKQENNEGGQGRGGLDDHFKMDVDPHMETRNDKVTENDLQKYMEMRNASPASQHKPEATPQ